MIQKTRVENYPDTLLLDAKRGIVKRFGGQVFDESLTIDRLRSIIRASSHLTGDVETNLFWLLEIRTELRKRNL